jgi:hypothetical protein
MAIVPFLLAGLALLLASHAARALATGVMPMRVSAARRATRPRAFWAAVVIELVLVALALVGAVALFAR